MTTQLDLSDHDRKLLARCKVGRQPHCWETIDPPWRRAIERRTAGNLP